MRLSVHIADPGYCPICSRGARVFLDGLEQRRVFTADEEQGLVVVARVDAQGRTIPSPDRRGLQQETRHGQVRIERHAARLEHDCKVAAERARFEAAARSAARHAEAVW